VTVSLVAPRNGFQPNQLFHWRKLAAPGALTATGPQGRGHGGVRDRGLQKPGREPQRLLGQKTNWKPRFSRTLLRWRLAKKQMLRRCRGQGATTRLPSFAVGGNDRRPELPSSVVKIAPIYCRRRRRLPRGCVLPPVYLEQEVDRRLQFCTASPIASPVPIMARRALPTSRRRNRDCSGLS
jgi:transposase